MAFPDDARTDAADAVDTADTADTAAGAAHAAAPSPAERVRTILATAGSLTLEAEGFRCDLVGLHAATTSPPPPGHGRTADPDAGLAAGTGPGLPAATAPGWLLRLRPPADSALAARVVCSPTGDLPVRLHLTDVSPVEVRDRVRARVTLIGWLAPDEAQPEPDRLALRFDPAEAMVVSAAGATAAAGAAGSAATAAGAVEPDVAVVDLDELAAARPDPLAAEEPAMLLHMADAHRDAVDALTRLVDPAALHGVVRVQPLALDRRGLTLRLEHPRTHRDVRLPFPAPLTAACEAGPAIQTLLLAAHTCPRRRPHHGGG